MPAALTYCSGMVVEVVLDRASPVPLYYQLSSQLEQAIRSGDIKVGERIDTEIEIAERYGLSRPTVRQAIQELVNKGLLVRRRGVGTQVVHSRMHRPVESTSLYEYLKQADRNPTTVVLTLREDVAEGESATALQVAEGTPVHYLERLRLTGGEPMALIRNWLPADLVQVDREALESGSLYDLMRRQGVQVRVSHQRIGAGAATAAQAKLLHLKTGAPVLTMERQSFDDSGRAIEFARSVYRADSYEFETTVVDR